MSLVPYSPQIDLPRHNWRHVKRSRIGHALYCLRHPIHWFMAYQATHRDEPDERQQTLFLVAVVHGLVAWMIMSSN